MMENEIKIKLEVLKDWVGNVSLTRQDMQNVIDEAIKALEEIKLYRAIGTVKGYERAIQSSIENYNLYREYKAKVQEFEAIGTIEEFKALKEKNTPMRLAEHNFQDEVHHYLCPSCRNIVNCNQNYCEECGQALET